MYDSVMMENFCHNHFDLICGFRGATGQGPAAILPLHDARCGKGKLCIINFEIRIEWLIRFKAQHMLMEQ